MEEYIDYQAPSLTPLPPAHAVNPLTTTTASATDNEGCMWVDPSTLYRLGAVQCSE